MKSVWKSNLKKTDYPSLEKNKNTDVLIIGGGIAGVLCAYKLALRGVNYMLVEADEILNGITKNTTAKISISHGLIYDKIIREFDEATARLYAEANINAVNEYTQLCRNVDCDFEVKDSYVYSLDDSRKIEREVLALNKIGVSAEFVSINEIPVKSVGGVRVKNQAQFNPLKFLYSIAEGLNIYEHTKVIEIKPYKAITQNAEISYKKLIVATHFPIINKHGFYFLKMYQHRSYVIALKNAQRIDGMYVDGAGEGLSFRRYEDLLLLGGGGHRTGKQGGGWSHLESFAIQNYKNAEIVAKWATQDCITLDGIAYIGRCSPRLPDVFVITGFNKWGMTNAMLGADILTDLVEGKENRYSRVFSPERTVLRPQLLINAFESFIGLVTPTVPRCPHLGCALKYNKEEHSWDCPCHGSRFTKSGELIDNPATDDKRLL